MIRGQGIEQLESFLLISTNAESAGCGAFLACSWRALIRWRLSCIVAVEIHVR